MQRRKFLRRVETPFLVLCGLLVFFVLSYLIEPETTSLLFQILGYVIAGTIGVGTIAGTAYLLYLAVDDVMSRRERRLILKAERVKAESQQSLVTVGKNETLIEAKGAGAYKTIKEAVPVSTSQSNQNAVVVPAEPVMTVFLQDLLDAEVGCTLANVIFGVRRDETTSTFAAPFEEMVHVGIVGSSGWGKSKLLQTLVYQLAASKEPVMLTLVDVEGLTFRYFAGAKRLARPIVSTGEDAVELAKDLKKEQNARLVMLRERDVEKIGDYNRLEGIEPMPWHAVIIEEATALMEDCPEFHTRIARMILQARKVGIYYIFAGQEFKGTSLDPRIRRQISTKIGLHCNDHWQAQALGFGKELVDIATKGAAYIIIPGEQKCFIQTPLIRKRHQFLQEMHHPSLAPPQFLQLSAKVEEAEMIIDQPSPAEQVIVNKWNEGTPITHLAKMTYGGSGGNQTAKIREVLETFSHLLVRQPPERRSRY